MLKGLIIAIDGPAGSGKSTSAKLIAKKLDYLYIDTGAMYRAITFHVFFYRFKLVEQRINLLQVIGAVGAKILAAGNLRYLL